MSAEILRKAADGIRATEPLEHHLGHLDDRGLKTWLAVADWLEASAGIATWGKHIGIGPVASTVDAALAVARAYLGADQ